MVYGGLISLSLAGGPVSPSAVMPFPELIDRGAQPVRRQAPAHTGAHRHRAQVGTRQRRHSAPRRRRRLLGRRHLGEQDEDGQPHQGRRPEHPAHPQDRQTDRARRAADHEAGRGDPLRGRDDRSRRHRHADGQPDAVQRLRPEHQRPGSRRRHLHRRHRRHRRPAPTSGTSGVAGGGNLDECPVQPTHLAEPIDTAQPDRIPGPGGLPDRRPGRLDPAGQLIPAGEATIGGLLGPDGQPLNPDGTDAPAGTSSTTRPSTRTRPGSTTTTPSGGPTRTTRTTPRTGTTRRTTSAGTTTHRTPRDGPGDPQAQPRRR